ncbi:MAG: YjjG family noncanonical pyrimidine nucleotidase [Eubacteriales bacterium]|nr:YjjG family noncanonical pyrimidine nucleotidase [Eubacteriales bacterium]
MITTFLFDLDETILDFKKAEAIALGKALEALEVEPTKERIELYSRINESFWKMLEQGKITRNQVLIGRFEKLFHEIGVECNAVKAREIYEKHLGTGHYFMPDALEVLQELSKKYRLYLVSNGTASVQAGRIESAGIAPLFQEMFISENIGYNKPSVEFFDYCFKRIPDFSREAAIIVGDSLTSDIRGGNNAGIKTCWFNPYGKQRTDDVNIDFEITKLTQLLKLF